MKIRFQGASESGLHEVRHDKCGQEKAHRDCCEASFQARSKRWIHQECSHEQWPPVGHPRRVGRERRQEAGGSATHQGEGFYMLPVVSVVLCANPAPSLMSCKTQQKALNLLNFFFFHWDVIAINIILVSRGEHNDLLFVYIVKSFQWNARSHPMNKILLGILLVVQWLRIDLPMQGTQAQFLFRELRSHMPRGS